MPRRLVLPLVFCAGLAWSAAAYPFGVLTAQAEAEPAKIELGGQAEIRVAVNDGFGKPIAQASVKISTDSGWFEASNQNQVTGFTDRDGAFQAVWHSNRQTLVGHQSFAVAVIKNGYVGKYPITATAKLTVGDPSLQESSPAPGQPAPTLP
jgi:hypothetical protein